MLLNQSNTEVLTIISQHPIGLDTANIFKRIVDDYKDSAITTPEGVSKAVWTLRAKDCITTAKDLKKKLHKITPLGISALMLDSLDSNERLELAITTDITGTELATVGSKSTAKAEIPVMGFIPEPFTLKFTPEELEDLVDERINDFLNGDIAITAAIASAKKAGFAILDPHDDHHKFHGSRQQPFGHCQKRTKNRHPEPTG